MMRAHVRLFCVLALTALPVSADSGNTSGLPLSFGSVQHQSEQAPILWEAPANVELTAELLRFTRPGTFARSQPLPLRPLQYYRISSQLASGPGSRTHFSIAYLDAQGKAVEWTPSWQLKGSTHPSWLPLSPRKQRYVQGFVLPLGATQPRLQLRLDASEKGFAAYSRWELSQVRFEATQAVATCKQLGEDRLFGGDLEGPARNGLPAWWLQWSLTPDNHVELFSSNDACKHVLRVKPGSNALLASAYLVPVTPGSAYRLALRARGHGRVNFYVDSLSRDRPTPLRVGNATRVTGTFEVNTDTWTQLSDVWFAEAPNVASAQVVIAIAARAAVDIDAVELRPCEISSP